MEHKDKISLQCGDQQTCDAPSAKLQVLVFTNKVWIPVLVGLSVIQVVLNKLFCSSTKVKSMAEAPVFIGLDTVKWQCSPNT